MMVAPFGMSATAASALSTTFFKFGLRLIAAVNEEAYAMDGVKAKKNGWKTPFGEVR
jgi:hypothetical protein